MNLKLISPLFFALFLIFSLSSHGQNCEPYYPMSEGASFEQTSYNAKDKVTGYQRHEVLSVSGGGDHMEAQMRVTHYDKKDKEGFVVDYSMVCDGEVFHVDMQSMIPSTGGAAMEMDMTVEADNLEFPASMSGGMELPDAHLKASMASTSMGISMGGISVSITERKVQKEESITTSAGTFDCFVIMQKEESKVMGIKVRSQSKTWYSKGAGMVRSESYDKNGKLRSYTVLTKLEQ